MRAVSHRRPFIAAANPIPYRPFIAAPRPLTAEIAPPAAAARLSLRRLCDMAGVSFRVTSPHVPAVILHPGTDHFFGPSGYYVGTRGPFDGAPESALRILEILAHGFHDYAARECVCGRGLFGAPARRGRPSLMGRPMTPAERVRRGRHRRRPRAAARER